MHAEGDFVQVAYCSRESVGALIKREKESGCRAFWFCGVSQLPVLVILGKPLALFHLRPRRHEDMTLRRWRPASEVELHSALLFVPDSERSKRNFHQHARKKDAVSHTVTAAVVLKARSLAQSKVLCGSFSVQRAFVPRSQNFGQSQLVADSHLLFVWPLKEKRQPKRKLNVFNQRRNHRLGHPHQVAQLSSLYGMS